MPPLSNGNASLKIDSFPKWDFLLILLPHQFGKSQSGYIKDLKDEILNVLG